MLTIDSKFFVRTDADSYLESAIASFLGPNSLELAQRAYGSVETLAFEVLVHLINDADVTLDQTEGLGLTFLTPREVAQTIWRRQTEVVSLENG